MKKYYSLLVIGLLSYPLMQSAQAAPDELNMINDDAGKASYAIGLNIGDNLKQQAPDYLNQDALLLGIEDALNDQPLRISEDALSDAIEAVHQEEIARVAEESEQNLAASQAYLQDNAAKSDVQTTASGLQYRVISEGNGATPSATDVVEVKYTGTLIDGTQFDSSNQHGGSVEFRVNEVIAGWTEALESMSVGSKWEVTIPPELAYGATPPPTIPPNSTLIFDIELVRIVE